MHNSNFKQKNVLIKLKTETAASTVSKPIVTKTLHTADEQFDVEQARRVWQVTVVANTEAILLRPRKCDLFQA